jgi:TetR/AcrR family transcriptional regulator, regulator of biofilm formation and stress response
MPFLIAETPQDRRKAPETRQRILRATLELIGNEGIGALSNRRIAAAAGVSLGSLTYHFPSQEDLLRESLDLYVKEEVARLEAIAAELRSRCPAPAEVAAEVQRLAAESADRPEQIAELELHLHAARDPALQEASRRCFLAYEGVAAAALEALRVPDPDRHAPAVVALMTGTNARQLSTGRHDAAGLADALRTLVRGARTEASRRSDQHPESK